MLMSARCCSNKPGRGGMERFCRFGVIAVSVALLVTLMAGLADARIYTWKDEKGVTTFTDDATLAPEGVKVKVWSNKFSGQSVSMVRMTKENPDISPGELPSSVKQKQPAEALPSRVTQGEFTVQLARELGLGQSLSPEEAAGILSDIRIAPPLGEWELNAVMDPELTTRLRTLTVSAPQMGWISVTPEQALLAFDAAAALLGLPIPIRTDKEIEESSQPVVAVPPLVYLSAPPPRIASYYVWVPVSTGFLWYGSTVHGYYALHGVHLNAHHFNGRHFVFKPHFVQRHFVNHLPGHQVVEQHGIRHRGQPARHFTTTILPPSHPIRHRIGISEHDLHSRQAHLQRPHIGKHVVHHETPRVRDRVRHRSSASRHSPGRPHLSAVPHTPSESHTVSKTPSASRQHRGRGSSHSESTGDWSGYVGGHGYSSSVGVGHAR